MPPDTRDLLHRLHGLLLERRSVVLLGRPGLGRTSVLRELERLIGTAGATVHMVRGTDGDSGVALAPFAPLVESYLREPGTALPSVLEIYSALPAALAEAGAVVLVDDLDLVEKASSVLVAQLARAGVPLVVAVPDEQSLPRSIRDDLAGTWAREQLHPLGPDDVLAMAAHLAGDELSATSAALLVTHAMGVPRRVVEILRACSATTTHTVSGVDLGPLAVTPALQQLVADDLAGLSDPAAHALSLLVLSGRLPADALPAPAAEELADRGLVAWSDTQVELTDPLVDDVVSAGLAPPARARLNGEAADLLQGREEWQGLATLLTARAGREVDAPSLVAAAERALAAHRYDESLELLERSGEDSALHRLLRGSALSATELPEEAATALDEAAAADDPALRVRAGQQLGLLHAVRRSDPATAVERVREVAATLEEPALRRLLEIDLVKWRLMAGLDPVPVPGVPDPRDDVGQVNAALIDAMVASLDGDPSAAQAHVDAGLAATARTDAGPAFAADLLRLSSYLARCFDGHLAEAEEMALGHRDLAARTAHPSLGMWEYATAELALHSGRYARAAVLSARAVRHLAWQDFTGLRPAATALRAAVAARQGRWALVDELQEQVTDAHRADIKVELHVARIEAERRLRVEDAAGAAEVLARAGRRAVEQSHRHLGVMAIDEAFVTCPAAAAADELAALAPSSILAGVLARRARALVDHDVVALSAAVDELTGVGLSGRAAHAAALVGLAHADRGQHEAARRAQRRQVLLLASTEASPWPLRSGPVILSDRELEVARLAARRLRSREIAEACGISVRTVDNHLARIYRKLGITGRDDLPDAMADLDRPASG
ncbi:helix-turn-helix transcriptional regulator [Nocardioides psychrotolerans]|uniref:helix-turn-helix transcriptional regulator n=1 Tax=Nocardioides psychrotolerans TaxID=1005945 RepID=UPI003137E44A